MRLKTERFALTANNITYAAFGEAMKYWQFFPADEGFGCIPVWGFATVVESRCTGITPGLLRLSVGLEATDDLIADLEYGLSLI